MDRWAKLESLALDRLLPGRPPGGHDDHSYVSMLETLYEI